MSGYKDRIFGGYFSLTLQLVRERFQFLWINLRGEVKEWCRKCVTRARTNDLQKRKVTAARQYSWGAFLESRSYRGPALPHY